MKRIGITETFDPCFVPDWETKLLDANIVISKELNDEMIEKLLVVQERQAFMRCRVSVVDLYPHVKQRLTAVGYKVFYDNFTAPDAVFRRVDALLAPYYHTFTFEACADPKLLPYNILECGCASYKDLGILGVDDKEYGQPEKKQRAECKCLAKKQILDVKPRRCPHGCLYCFWKD